jgi:hypothetical protein
MIYNVVLNSNNRDWKCFIERSYNFDWSNLEEGAYELTFTFNAVGSLIR